MEMTQIAVLAAVLIFTLVLWMVTLVRTKKNPYILILTVAVTLIALLVVLDFAGVTAIFGDFFAEPPPAVTP